MKRIQAAFVALLVGLGCSLGAGAQHIFIATGGPGGVYHPMGGGLAQALSKHVPGMQASAQVTGGSVDNLMLVGTGKPYVGFTMSDAALDAFQGEDRFKASGKLPLRTLAVLYPNRMHVVTVEGKGIQRFADLKGKRVSTGAPGSATEVMALRLIEAAGLDKDKDLLRERLGAADSVNAIKDDRIDAFFWVGGLPTAAVSDLANTPGTTIRMIDHAELVPVMNRKWGNLYVEDTIPKEVYKGMAADNRQATVMNILVAHENMEERTAYNIVRAIFEMKDELVAGHKEAVNLKLENQRKEVSPIPFHPGAVRYLAERGVKLE